MLVLGLVLGLAFHNISHHVTTDGSVALCVPFSLHAVSADILGHDLCFELAADRMRLQPLNQHSDYHSTFSFAGLLCDCVTGGMFEKCVWQKHFF